MTVAHAPGKVILCGEHAVVYGRPAIAVPVAEVCARACVEPGPVGQGTVIIAPDLGRRVTVCDAEHDDPLAHIVRLALKKINAPLDPDLTITVTSTIPIARGMGSGAAVSTAIVKALAQDFGCFLSSRGVSELVYQSEVIHHGTPSGIDNTVVAFRKPIYFVKDEGWHVFWVGQPFLLAIADTGISSSTREVVGDLRRRYQEDPARFGRLFDRVGQVVDAARSAIQDGEVARLGELMNQNHTLLTEMGVSSPELDCLVKSAREGGALGAKLSGAGWGGNMIALVTEESRGRVDMMLRLAGARDVVTTVVQ